MDHKTQVVAMCCDGSMMPGPAQADVVLLLARYRVSLCGCTDHINSGDLRGVARAIDLSRSTLRNIKQKLVFGRSYNVILSGSAAGPANLCSCRSMASAVCCGSNSLGCVDTGKITSETSHEPIFLASSPG